MYVGGNCLHQIKIWHDPQSAFRPEPKLMIKNPREMDLDPFEKAHIKSRSIYEDFKIFLKSNETFLEYQK